ncbi:MAG: serine acetyltransferase [Muribaculaceae bacterium]
MKDIAIYGAGGFGREVACLIRKINEVTPTWKLIGFFDDGKDIGSKNEYGSILGGINELNNWDTELSIAIAIASPKIVSLLVSKIKGNNISFPNIIAPDTTFLDENNILLGKGNIFCSSCSLSCNISIGDFNIFNGFITIGHDVKISNFNSFMPAVRVSGEVLIGNNNFFGVSSIILQQIKIANGIVLGANSVMMRTPKDNETYVGNPAKIIKY